MTLSESAILCAGVPSANNTLLSRCNFLVGDPVVYLEINKEDQTCTIAIVRDIEMKRAREKQIADVISCPADFKPESGLSGDRETATAQATAECLFREGIKQVIADRSLPLIYAEMLKQRQIEVICDTELWVQERRQKSDQEQEYLAEAQQVTEGAMRLACELVANAEADAKGILFHDGDALTSGKVRAAIDHYLLDQGYENPSSIVAAGPLGADCHNLGTGKLKTGQTVIIDIFPRNKQTRYCGDCTRTVVHGEIPDAIKQMHHTVCLAKDAAEKIVKPGVTGEQVHQAVIDVLTTNGYSIGLPTETDPLSLCYMPHGTGHGIGLDVHEPPLLDFKGPPLLIGDALTIEPGLYRKDMGGVRVEDMVIVTQSGCKNLNKLPTGLTWK